MPNSSKYPSRPANQNGPVRIALLSLPEASASVIYGMQEVLSSVGCIWPTLSGDAPAEPGFSVRIVSRDGQPFEVAGGIPVIPKASLDEVEADELVLIPDLAIDNRTDPHDRWPELCDWLRFHHKRGGFIGTVCTGAVLLACTGLLDGRPATVHWAFESLFRTHFPKVNLQIEKILVSASPEDTLITGGGAGVWEDLCLYLTERFCSRTEALNTARLFVLGDRSDGQLPYASMLVQAGHKDGAVADSQAWIAERFAEANPVTRMIERSGIPARTFVRRFKAATGFAPVHYVQSLRIEEAKRQLERTALPTEDVGAAIGYEDPAFFRRLFKRTTGVSPARYRQRMQRMVPEAV